MSRSGESRLPSAALLELSRRLPDGLSVVLALLIGLQVSTAVHGLKSMRYGAHAGVGSAAPLGPADVVAEIVNGHLFGESPPAAMDAAATFSLTLSGVIAMPDATRGLAIVAADGGAAHVYAVGGQLPGGARLIEVYRDRVIVEAGGARQQLQLPRRIGAGGTMLAGLPNAADPETLEAKPEQFGSADFQAKALISGALPVATGAARILRPEAVVADGQLQGYQVFPTDPDKLGVQSGDELVAVNDTKLSDPDVAARVLKRLDSSSATSVKLTLLHDGQPYDLVVGADALRWHRP